MTAPKPLPCPHCGTALSLAGNLWVHPRNVCMHFNASLLDEPRQIRIWNRRAARWQPIATAPKDGMLLLWQSGSDVYGGYWDGYSECWTNGEDELSPTHWMPLPQPPTQEVTKQPAGGGR